MAEAHQAPIIIIKKKAHHDEHHGGAWKVAYADFVTAMMALFIVLWLLSSSEQVKKAVGGYFQDPTGKGRQTGSTNAGIGETLTLSKDNLQQIKEKIDMLMRQMPTFDRIKDQVKMTVTAEGLRIDLMETQGGMFFETGNPRPTKAGGDLITSLAQELAKLPNKIAIEGHTDSTPYGREDYSNWELSTDRANSARRLMQAQGLRPDQLNQVRGFADQRLMKPDDPTNPKNRRISIIVRSIEIDAQEDAGRALAAKAAEGKSGEGKPAEGKPAEGKAEEKAPAVKEPEKAAEPAKSHH